MFQLSVTFFNTATLTCIVTLISRAASHLIVISSWLFSLPSAVCLKQVDVDGCRVTFAQVELCASRIYISQGGNGAILEGKQGHRNSTTGARGIPDGSCVGLCHRRADAADRIPAHQRVSVQGLRKAED